MNLKTVLAVLLGAVLLFTACAGLAEPSAASAQIPALKTAVNRENLRDYDFTEKALEYLSVIAERFPDRSAPEKAGNGPHEAAGDWLIAELEACGYDRTQIEEQPFTATNFYGETVQGRNIILTVPGRRAEQIIAGAHYDGDGIGDNGSGTALLLAAAAGLADTRPEYTLRYIFFDAEEFGKLGSTHYAGQMSGEEIASTLYMINLDALAFGDFCNLYGGIFGDSYNSDFIAVNEDEPLPEPEQTEAYEFAAGTAEKLGFKVYRPADLDGYYDRNGRGMKVEDGAFFTNPWTAAHPAPENMLAPSPAAFGASDHAPFAELGIPYIYFEATNWWAKGSDPWSAYTGYPETYDETLGDGGQFMNTRFDTLETLDRIFPGRAEQHYRQYSPLLSALLLACPD